MIIEIIEVCEEELASDDEKVKVVVRWRYVIHARTLGLLKVSFESKEGRKTRRDMLIATK